MVFGTGESLDTIVKRTKLPIEVTYLKRLDRWLIVDATDRRRWQRTAHSGVANRAYFTLVSQLSPSAAPPTPAEAGAQCAGTADAEPPSASAPIPATAATPCDASRSGGNSAGPSGPAPSLSRLA
jgi:hypothetical protein